MDIGMLVSKSLERAEGLSQAPVVVPLLLLEWQFLPLSQLNRPFNSPYNNYEKSNPPPPNLCSYTICKLYNKNTVYITLKIKILCFNLATDNFHFDQTCIMSCLCLVYILFLSFLCLFYVLSISCLYLVYILSISCLCLVYFLSVLSMSCLCLVYVLSKSCLCLVYVLSMSCFCLFYVLSISCLFLVYILSISCLYLVYVLSMSCLCLVYVLSMSCLCLLSESAI